MRLISKRYAIQGVSGALPLLTIALWMNNRK